MVVRILLNGSRCVCTFGSVLSCHTDLEIFIKLFTPVEDSLAKNDTISSCVKKLK